MSDSLYAGDKLLDAWLSLTSTLWNTRIVQSMTFNEAHVMGILLRRSTQQSPLTATDLIKRTHLLKSQMNKVLSTLESKGYIQRLRSESDRRMAHILLTDEGRSAYLAEHKNVEALLIVLIDQLGPDRAAQIAEDLNAVTNLLTDILPSP